MSSLQHRRTSLQNHNPNQNQTESQKTQIQSQSQSRSTSSVARKGTSLSQTQEEDGGDQENDPTVAVDSDNLPTITSRNQIGNQRPILGAAPAAGGRRAVPLQSKVVQGTAGTKSNKYPASLSKARSTGNFGVGGLRAIRQGSPLRGDPARVSTTRGVSGNLPSTLRTVEHPSFSSSAAAAASPPRVAPPAPKIGQQQQIPSFHFPARSGAGVPKHTPTSHHMQQMDSSQPPMPLERHVEPQQQQTPRKQQQNIPSNLQQEYPHSQAPARDNAAAGASAGAGSEYISVGTTAPSTPQYLSLSEQRRELESLEMLLQEAGYKETRVFTPEAERLRARRAEQEREQEQIRVEAYWSAQEAWRMKREMQLRDHQRQYQHQHRHQDHHHQVDQHQESAAHEVQYRHELQMSAEMYDRLADVQIRLPEASTGAGRRDLDSLVSEDYVDNTIDSSTKSANKEEDNEGDSADAEGEEDSDLSLSRESLYYEEYKQRFVSPPLALKTESSSYRAAQATCSFSTFGASVDIAPLGGSVSGPEPQSRFMPYDSPTPSSNEYGFTDQHEAFSASPGFVISQNRAFSSGSSPSFGNSAMTSPDVSRNAYSIERNAYGGHDNEDEEGAKVGLGLDWWNSLMGVQAPSNELTDVGLGDQVDDLITPVREGWASDFASDHAFDFTIDPTTGLPISSIPDSHPQRPALIGRNVSSTASAGSNTDSAYTYETMSNGSGTPTKRKRKVLNRIDTSDIEKVVKGQTTNRDEKAEVHLRYPEMLPEDSQGDAFDPSAYEQRGDDTYDYVNEVLNGVEQDEIQDDSIVMGTDFGTISTRTSLSIRRLRAPLPPRSPHHGEDEFETLESGLSSRSSSMRRSNMLRHAISTPLLDQVKINISRPLGWLGNVGRFWSNSVDVPTVPSSVSASASSETVTAKPKQARRMKSLVLGPAKPASPKLVVQSAVVCETVEGEDLPPLPFSTIRNAGADSCARGAGGNYDSSSFSGLRKKLSLQILRFDHGKNSSHQITSSNTPTLMPRAQWHDRESGDVKKSDKDNGIGFNQHYGSAISKDSFEPDFSKSFFYSPPTPPNKPSKANRQKQPKRQESIRSLRAHLLRSTAEATRAPPMPALPAQYAKTTTTTQTTPKSVVARQISMPVLAISSPGACERGLPPKELVLEGEEWECGSGPSSLGSARGSPRMKKRDNSSERDSQKKKGMVILERRGGGKKK